MPTYSKTRVDRAGRLFADQVSRFAEDSNLFEDPAEAVQATAAITVIDRWRSEHARPLSRVAANLRHYVGKEGAPIVAQRLKRVPTIAGKLLREPSMKLSRMADIGGVRAILPDQAAAYRVASQLRRNWTITRTRDYVAEPKDDGYRALHLISRNHGWLIEIQLRTPFQDAWANTVEALSRNAFPGLKFGGGPVEAREFLLDYAEIVARHDSGLASTEETLDQINRRLAELANLSRRQ